MIYILKKIYKISANRGEKMIYDLHIHSKCSDGKYTRLELLHRLNMLKANVVCFTDHNYVDTDNDLNKLTLDYENIYFEKECIKLYNATELDVEENPFLHILGYDLKKPEVLQKTLMNINLENIEICRAIVENIKKHFGIEISFNELAAMTTNGFVRKSTIAQWLVSRGHIDNIRDAFSVFLSKGSPCYIKKRSLTLIESIQLINESHGISILAHPSSLNYNEQELTYFIEKLIDYGIKGIEIFNASKNNEEQMNTYKKIANKYNLYQTSGSDFHNDNETPIITLNNTNSEKFIKMLEKRGK